MKVVLANPTPAGFETSVLDRVYDNFQSVQTGAGPPMYEPHRIRQEFARGFCPESDDPGPATGTLITNLLINVGLLDSDIKDDVKLPDTSGCVLDERFLSDAYRKDFIVNGDWLNPQEKALLASQPW